MIHLRIIGSVWMLLGALGATACAAEGFRLLSHGSGFDDSAVASSLVALFFCLGAVAIGFGLVRARRWAVVCIRVIAVLFLLYCLSFVFMSHFSFAWVGLLGFALAVYTLYGAGKCKPPGHAT